MAIEIITPWMTGYQAAKVIYDNDRQLAEGVQVCADTIQAVDDMLVMADGKINVVQTTGDSLTDVMSQKAITDFYEESKERIQNARVEHIETEFGDYGTRILPQSIIEGRS